MKKNLIIVISVVLVLLLCGLFFVRSLSNRQEESMPDIEQVGTMQENIVTPEEEAYPEVSEEKPVQKVTETETPNNNVIKKAVKKVQNKLSHEKEPVELREPVTELKYVRTVEEDVTKVVSEEEEALKKVPPSGEVVIDKEIKSKSSGKYVFK